MRTFVVAAGLVAGIVTAALAAETVVTQKGKNFSQSELEISAGDTVKFVNDDGITHNVYSSTDGHAFDLGAQQPGSETSHKFTAAGDVKVRCAIHPKMKMTIKVK